jgi:hypothetical protein
MTDAPKPEPLSEEEERCYRESLAEVDNPYDDESRLMATLDAARAELAAVREAMRLLELSLNAAHHRVASERDAAIARARRRRSNPIPSSRPDPDRSQTGR